MTVQNATLRADYFGNSSATFFTVPFYFLDASQLQVLLTDNVGGPVVPLVLDSDYTVAGAGNTAGGSITTMAVYAATQKISILRDVPYTQLTHYVENDPFPAASHERALDLLTMQNQQQEEQLARALILPPNTTGIDPTLPIPAEGMVLGWVGGKLANLAAGTAQLAVNLLVASAGTGTSLVNYLAPWAGAVGRLLNARLADYVSITDFGCVADSNGSSGNGTNNSPFLQAAVNYAVATGRRLWVPSGQGKVYRFSTPINFALGGNQRMAIHGESELGSQFFADMTNGVMTAAWNINNASGNRVYIDFQNFSLVGVNDVKTCGIYCNWTSGYSQMRDVLVMKFYNNIVIANDYYMKLWNITSEFALNNGLQVGYLLDGVTQGPCNNMLIIGGEYANNTGNGIYIFGAQTLGLTQVSSETNKYANIYIANSWGISLSGIYSEFAPGSGGTPVAQILFDGCSGVSVNGVSVSAFDVQSRPIFLIRNGCAGVTLAGLGVSTNWTAWLPSHAYTVGQTVSNGTGVYLCTVAGTSAGSGGPTGTGSGIADGGVTWNFASTIGVQVDNSFGVSIAGSITNCAIGVAISASSRVTLDGCYFQGNYYAPVMTDTTGLMLDWRGATAAQVAACNFSAANILDIRFIDGTEWVVGNLCTFNIPVIYSDLSGGLSKQIITHKFPGEQWRIVDIVAVDVAAFAGGGGNRNLQVTDGTRIWTLIPAATLGTLNFQARWGSTGVPYSATYYHMINPTSAGSDLVASYSGGSADYTAGQLTLVITAQRVK